MDDCRALPDPNADEPDTNHSPSCGQKDQPAGAITIDALVEGNPGTPAQHFPQNRAVKSATF